MPEVSRSAWPPARLGESIIRSVEQDIADYRRDAEQRWTPGNACWALSQELETIEDEITHFRSPLIDWATKIDWLGQVLHASVRRSSHVRDDQLSGVMEATNALTAALKSRYDCPQGVLDACGILRLEISYVATS